MTRINMVVGVHMCVFIYAHLYEHAYIHTYEGGTLKSSVEMLSRAASGSH